MASTTNITALTRPELYDLVWSTPMRVLAPKFGLSDVGLAKICKKNDIPRPPVGYWAKVEHGKKVRRPKLPPVTDGAVDSVILEPKPPRPSTEPTEPAYFDEQLADLARRIGAGELVTTAGTDLRGCRPLTRRSRDALKASNRKPTRDRWGVLQHPEQYTESHVPVSTSKEQRQRALLLLDAVVKTFDAIGVEQQESGDRWHRSVVFVLREWKFSIRIKEKTKRHDHVLTEQAERARQRYKHSYAPKYDYLHTGQLMVELTYAGSGSHFMQLKDGKRAGPVENQLARLALCVVQRADSHLARKAREVEERHREIERQNREREEAERRRVEEEARKAELACQDRLLRMAEDWRLVSSLGSFLEEVGRRIGAADVTDHEGDLLERWLRWGTSVAKERDPFGRPLGDLPEITHPGIRESERRAREARASEATTDKTWSASPTPLSPTDNVLSLPQC